MRLLACLLLLAACACPARAAGGSVIRSPVEDIGLPFWCDWGYAPNRGVLLKLAEEAENFGVSGPSITGQSP